MKRFLSVALTLLMLISLASCVSQTPSYTASVNGKNYRVDTDNCTISDETQTYRYEFSGDPKAYSITVIYPNGASYWRSKKGNSWSEGWSDDYEEYAYVPGGTLCKVIEEGFYSVNIRNLLPSILLILFGALLFAYPRFFWYIRHGWHYQNAEPSDLSLIAQKICGAVAILLGVLAFFLFGFQS